MDVSHPPQENENKNEKCGVIFEIINKIHKTIEGENTEGRVHIYLGFEKIG